MELKLEDAKLIYEIMKETGIDPRNYGEFNDYYIAVVEALTK